MPLSALHSIRTKIFASVLATSMAAVVLTGVSLFYFDMRTFRATTVADLEILAELIGYASQGALQFDDRSMAGDNLAFLAARSSVRAAALYDSGGALFATYARIDHSEGELPAHPVALGVDEMPGRITVSHRLGSGSQPIGNIYIDADFSTRARIAEYAIVASAVGLGAFALSGLIALWLQAGISRPIVEIARVAHEVVEHGDYSKRAARTSNDEIGVFVSAFNNMLARIEERNAALAASSREVQRLNDVLEARVQERTAQLEETNRQLENASLAKDRFLASMSHELRTPLNAVIGFTGTLLMKLPGALNLEQEKQLRIVQGSGRHLLALINDLLDLAKIEAGKIELVLEPTSCQAVLGEVAAALASQAQAKHIALEVDAPDEPVVIPADRRALSQILLNLAGNAIKFTDRGRVAISLRNAHDASGAARVEIAISDTGVGMRPEELKELFGAFAQARSSDTRRFEGTGLGLHLSRRLAQLLGGEIQVTSQFGVGSIFTLLLPGSR